MAGPLLSHNAATNNILLQITVPKRTGRKRKRGSQDAYHEVVNDQSAANERSSSSQPDGLCSHSRRPNPKELLRTLRDNVDKYKVEAVARIDYTHRFRGMN
jgi:general transcription factor 3C polypeptide 5 (transcription factor C subunit 1)